MSQVQLTQSMVDEALTAFLQNPRHKYLFLNRYCLEDLRALGLVVLDADTLSVKAPHKFEAQIVVKILAGVVAEQSTMAAGNVYAALLTSMRIQDVREPGFEERMRLYTFSL